MQISQSDLKRHLQQMNINENTISPEQLQVITNEINKRLDEENLDFQPHGYKPRSVDMNSVQPAQSYKASSIVHKPPHKAETGSYSKSQLPPVVIENDEPKFDDKKTNSHDIMAQIQMVNEEKENYKQKQQELEEQLQNTMSKLSASHHNEDDDENKVQQQAVKPEQNKADTSELDQLAEEIIRSKAYTRKIKQIDNKNMQDIINNQTQIQKTLQKSQSQPQQTIQPADFHSSQQTTELPEEIIFDQQQNTKTINQMNGSARMIYRDLPQYQDSRQQLIAKRADVVERWNYYNQCWSVQGAPQDRRKRIVENKAKQIVQQNFKRIQEKRQQDRQAYEVWRQQQEQK